MLIASQVSFPRTSSRLSIEDFVRSILEFLTCLFRPTAYANPFLDDVRPLCSSHGPALLQSAFGCEEVSSGLIECCVGDASVRQRVADDPLLHCSPRPASRGGVFCGTCCGEDSAVVHGRRDGGGRRAQRKQPFDLVVSRATHADAPFSLRLVMRLAEWMQIGRLCPAAEFRVLVVERDAVVDLAFLRRSAAPGQRAGLPFAEHRQTGGFVRLVLECDFVEDLPRRWVREHPVPELGRGGDGAGHVRWDGLTCDGARPVIQPQQRGHRDCHDDSRLLAEDRCIIRAHDVDVVALGLAVRGYPLQDSLRARGGADEEVEHQLSDRAVIGA